MSSLELRFKNYIESTKISIEILAKLLGVNIKILKKYMNGELYPSRKIMEKIVIITEGKIQPIDFLFQYRKDFNIIDYIQHNLELGLVTKKELAIELNIASSNICRRLKGEYNFKKGEIITIINLIEAKKQKKGLANV